MERPRAQIRSAGTARRLKNCEFYIMGIVRRPNLTVTRRHALALGAAVGSLTLATRRAGAVRIDITEGNFQPLPIAIPNFFGGADSDTHPAVGVTQTIPANRKGRGLSLPIDPAAFLEKLASVD